MVLLQAYKDLMMEMDVLASVCLILLLRGRGTKREREGGWGGGREGRVSE